MTTKFIDLTGATVGEWTVLRRADNTARGTARWLVRHRCGREKVARSDGLRSGTVGCACIPRPSRLSDDLTGRSFGLWTVLSRAENTADGHPRWNARCACGRERVVLGGTLRSGGSRSCGCKHLTHHGDSLAGQKFGRLTVLGYTADRRYVLAVCECGDTTITPARHLRSGHAKSCGCLRHTDAPTYNTVHKRTTAARGPASDYECEAPWCSARAAQWGYYGTDPAELSEVVISARTGRPYTLYYSADPKFYGATCLRDHRLADKAIAAWRARQTA